VVLTNADVDHVAGLLNLRESQPLAVYGHARVLDVLAANSIFNVLNPAFVARRPLVLETGEIIRDRDGRDLGVTVRAFAVPGKVALWLEDARQAGLGTAEGDTIGLEISGNGRTFFYIPGCAAMTPDLAARLRAAELVFFDGTLWRDDEMIVAGVGTKTGQRMGHMSCTDTIAAFRDLGVARKLFVHINNTNPLLLGNSPQRHQALAAGWDVAHDGMEIVLESENRSTLAAAGI
jgi:pyrroloquinoline quinone biosynthesis protein B